MIICVIEIADPEPGGYCGPNWCGGETSLVDPWSATPWQFDNRHATEPNYSNPSNWPIWIWSDFVLNMYQLLLDSPEKTGFHWISYRRLCWKRSPLSPSLARKPTWTTVQPMELSSTKDLVMILRKWNTPAILDSPPLPRIGCLLQFHAYLLGLASPSQFAVETYTSSNLEI